MNALIKSFFAKPGYAIAPIRADRAEECETMHAASFAFPWSRHDFESYLTDQHVIADGALTEGTRSASMIAFILSRLIPPDAEVLTFAVDPSRRREGVGRTLLESHLTTLERGGARLVFLEVGADNVAALSLYERFGFKIIGRRENYYLRANGERHAALAMRLEI
jgi:ribosomal-protein-alanine N-acetyltransferase